MENLTTPVLIESTKLFNIYFVPLIEYISLSDTFEASDVEEIRNQIERGDLEYFCAKVYSTFQGNEIVSDYLGACCYESFESFCTTYKEDYFDAMVETVKEETFERLTKIKEILVSAEL